MPALMDNILSVKSRLTATISKLHPQSYIRTVSIATCRSLAIVLVYLLSILRYHHVRGKPNSIQEEVWIEWLSWFIIYVVCKSAQLLDICGEEQYVHGHFLWAKRGQQFVAVAAAVSSQLISSQPDVALALPLVTMMVTGITSTLSGQAEASHAANDKDAPPPYEQDGESLVWSRGYVESLTSPALVILNVVCFVALFRAPNPQLVQTTIYSTFFFLSTRSALVYMIAKQNSRPENYMEADAFTKTSRCAQSLVPLAMTSLTLLLVIVRPDLELSSFNILHRASTQAVWWLSMLFLLQSRLYHTAVNLDTAALSTELAIFGSNSRSTAAALLALMAVAAQAIIVLRPARNIRKVTCGLIATMVIGIWVMNDPRLVTMSVFQVEGQYNNGHPITNLMVTARAEFNALVLRQSTNIAQATAEYERRYGRPPPQGFEHWVELALEKDFMLIDEFDTLMASLEPFHGVHPTVLQQRVSKMMERASGQIVTYNVTNGNLSISEKFGDIGRSITDPEWLKFVPYNVTIAINALDEAMVSASWEEVSGSVEAARKERNLQDTTQTNLSPILQVGKQSAWAATFQACSMQSPARQMNCLAANRKLSDPLRFLNNVTHSKDVCQNCELLQQEGFFMSPETLNLAHDLTPVWSASKPSHFHDILYPSSYYVHVRKGYSPDDDVSWDQKDNKVYWVGTATGGHVTADNWRLMQRQRLVLRTQSNAGEAIQLLAETPPNSGMWHPRFTTMSEIADLFSTRISRVVQCDEAACKQQKEAFGIADVNDKLDDKNAAFKNKFVLDVDGNTFSGRFYRLLQSKSMVIKQTVFKEWHDDRIFPWVHYAPLSTGYDELPEMARFFATTEPGMELAERMARESTEWHNRALRDVDIRLVWLRMLLEYGRLMNPEVEDR